MARRDLTGLQTQIGPLQIHCMHPSRVAGGGLKGPVVTIYRPDGAQGTTVFHEPLRLDQKDAVEAYAQAMLGAAREKGLILPEKAAINNQGELRPLNVALVADAINAMWIDADLGNLTPEVMELDQDDEPSWKDHNDEGRKFAIMKGQLYAVMLNNEGKIALREKLMNGFGKITADIVALDEDGTRERYVEITLRVRGRTACTRLRISDAHGTHLVGSLLQAMGTRLCIEPGAGKDLYYAFCAFGTPPETHVRSHTGWVRDEGGGLHYLDGQRDVLWLPGGDADSPIGVVLDPAEPVLSRYKMRRGASAEAGHTALSLLMDAVPQHIWIALLSTVGLALIHHLFETSMRPMVWLHGPTGRLKTALVLLACCFFGDFGSEGDLLTWGATFASWEVNTHVLKDSLLGLDDYKYRTAERRRVIRFIQQYSDSAGSQRRKYDLRAQHSYRARCIVLSSGEQTPSNEPSVMARLLVVPVTDVNPQKLEQAQVASGDLSGLTQALISWIAQQRDLGAWIQHEWKSRRAQYRRALPQGTNVLRIAGNIAQLAIAHDVLGRFLASRDWLEGTPEEWGRQGEAALLALGAAQVAAVEEESPHTGFLDVLAQLLQSGQLTLREKRHGLGDKVYPVGGNGPEVGMFTDAGVALYAGTHNSNTGPLAYQEVERYLKRSGQTCGPWHTVGSYLRDSNVLVRHDKDHFTTSIMVQRQRFKVVLVRIEALGLELPG